MYVSTIRHHNTDIGYIRLCMKNTRQRSMAGTFGRSASISNWESADFPILCDSCLGANPYIRMTKENFGRDCKVCLKPFTIFRWCPGPKMRFRKTEICTTCAKLRNLCQSCMLDLQFNLPSQVRDTLLGIKSKVPKNPINREYFLERNKLYPGRGEIPSLTDFDEATSSHAKAEALKILSRPRDGVERNLSPTCSFYARGKCTRGDTCPFRHVLIPEKYPSLQSYRDRYFGENDPAAKKILESTPIELEEDSDVEKPT